MPVPSSEALLAKLNGRRFPSYRAMEREVLAAVNPHIAALPPEFSPRALIDFGTARRWIIKGPEGFSVDTTNGHPS